MPPRLGFSFSHRQAYWLSLDPLATLERLLSSFSQPIVRLGCYWSESQPSPSEYDFTLIDQQLALCQRYQANVVLTLGAKAPRWPEFYIPSWLDQSLATPEAQQQLLDYLKIAITHFQAHEHITHWQIENEARDPSGPYKVTLPLDFLRQEFALVRSLDQRPLLGTLWGNDFLTKKTWQETATLADIIGLDLYYQQHFFTFLGYSQYRKPTASPQQLHQQIQQSNKPVWIAELQAEPWENDSQTFLRQTPPGFSYHKLVENYTTAMQINPAAILFWGAEYWVWRAETYQDFQYLEYMCQLGHC
jgi:hypothetical protein